jgi:hypothetical protein
MHSVPDVLLRAFLPDGLLGKHNYHHNRTHLGLDKDTPLGRPGDPRPPTPATVVGLPRVGGLHRRYVWRRAA